MTASFRTTVLLVALILMVASLALADIPKTISYQGYLTADDTPVSGSRSMVFSLYTTSSGGSPLWSETQPTVDVSNGIYQVALGSVTPINLSFDVQYYLGVKVGTDPDMIPRHPLTSVPYAMSAPLPSATSVNSSGSAFQVTNTGNGRAVEGYTNGSGTAIYGYNYGTGSAGYFGTYDAANSSPTLYATANGPGSVVYIRQYGNGNGLELDATGTSSNGGIFTVTDAANSSVALGANHMGTGPAISANAIGTGNAGFFNVSNTGSTAAALSVNTNGAGAAGWFTISNASNPSHALFARTFGTGRALDAYTTGSGEAVYGHTTGTGSAGSFAISNAANGSKALLVSTDGTGSGGEFEIKNASSSSAAVKAATSGTGEAVRGTSTSGAAIRGDASTGIGLYGTSSSSIGVYGFSTNSVGIKGESSNDTAIWGVASGTHTGVDGYNTSSGIGVVGRSSSGNGVKGETGNNIAVYGVNNSTSAPAVEAWNKGTGDIFKGWSGTSPLVKFYVANNGNAWLAGTLTQASDLRLKTDVQTLEKTLAKVMNLRGVSYVMKDDEDKARKVGVIAQELEQEYPELVATDEQGMKSVAYANLTAVLIEAVKEQQGFIRSQNERIHSLEERLALIEALLDGKRR